MLVLFFTKRTMYSSHEVGVLYKYLVSNKIISKDERLIGHLLGLIPFDIKELKHKPLLDGLIPIKETLEIGWKSYNSSSGYMDANVESGSLAKNFQVYWQRKQHVRLPNHMHEDCLILFEEGMRVLKILLDIGDEQGARMMAIILFAGRMTFPLAFNDQLILRMIKLLPSSKRVQYDVMNRLSEWYLPVEAISTMSGKSDHHVENSAQLTFNLTRFDGWNESVYDFIQVKSNLTKIIGEYVHKLNLSQSYITGSTVMAATFVNNEKRDLFASFEDYVESYYPAQYTKLENVKAFIELLRTIKTDEQIANIKTVNVTSANSDSDLNSLNIIIVQGKPFIYSTVPGVDVDIAVDTETIEQFDKIALEHFAVIQEYFPHIRLNKIPLEAGGHKYRIVATQVMARFREVDIYRNKWANICQHHFAMTRLAYTSAMQGGPMVKITASALHVAMSKISERTYYVSSKKVSPQELILKYMQRGFGFADLPRRCNLAFSTYINNSDRWNPENRSMRYPDRALYAVRAIQRCDYPAVNCLGNYNLLNLKTELKTKNKALANATPV